MLAMEAVARDEAADTAHGDAWLRACRVEQGPEDTVAAKCSPGSARGLWSEQNPLRAWTSHGPGKRRRRS